MALTSIEKFFHKLAIGEDLEHLKNVVNSKDPEDEQKTPLHKASEKGDLWNVKALVFLGAEMKARDKDGKTPLIFASNEGNTIVAKHLIEMGAQIDSKDNHNRTPLHYAKNTEIARCLIQRGAKIEANDKDLHTPLFFASIKGTLEMVKLLFDFVTYMYS